MSQEPVPIIFTQRPETLGEQVRRIADQLKEEGDLQIKVTSRILGAAAQIAENHDRLICEVVDMVEEDLDNKTYVYPITTYTTETLKQKFRTLGVAKSHFGLKASSWGSLANKLNNSSVQNPTLTEHSKISIPERLDSIENEIRILRVETSQILVLLQRLTLDKE